MSAHHASTVRYYEDLGCWVVWGETARRALEDLRLSSETLDVANLDYLPADVHEQCALLTETMRRWFVLLDGQAHINARRAIQPMFSPRRIRKLHPVIHAMVAESLEQFARSGSDDVVPHLADSVSARTIAHVLGLPGGDDQTLHRWARAMGDFLASSYRRDYAVDAQEALHEMNEFITNASTGVDGETVWKKASGSERDRLATSSMVLFGGLETTAGLTSLALWYMLGNQLQGVVSASESGGEVAAIVERALELYAPLGHVARMATEDIEFDGCAIPRGELVLVSLTGRDPFDSPQAPQQPAVHGGAARTDHVAFGLGTHYCMGAPLARLAVSSVLTLFARRYPYASVRSVSWRKNRTYRGFDHLHLNLTANAN